MLSRAGERPLLLYSGGGASCGGRFSLIGLSPAAFLRVSPGDPGDPFGRLGGALRGWTWAGGEKPPLPFFGGWAGYLSYDLSARLEHLLPAAPADHGFPLMEFAFCRRVLGYDHLADEWVAAELLDEDDPPADAEKALARLLREAAEAPLPERDPSPALSAPLRSNFSREGYGDAVRRALAYIEAGDVYQVNLSQRFEGRLRIPSEELALRLFETSPAPFSAFLRFGRRAIASSSPERFLRVRDGVAEAWPIKGTRPRGGTPEEDARLRAELIASAKDQAELVMITDLLRNDLGRVCAYGTVEVPDLRRVASYANVHHAYSRVLGRLRPGMDVVDLLRAAFPCGSVTGAPKIRAMEIIGELEPTARGPYCGAIGYIGVDGSADLSVTIRTVLCEAGRLTFQVGGGVVAESRPADEFEETLQKAQGILAALGTDGGRDE